MNSIYRALGISKQSFHQQMNRYIRQEEERYQLLPIIHEIRRDHPAMGARELYFLIQPKGIGRDRFEEFCFENGLRIAQKRSFIRTTNSVGVRRFPNLLPGLELTHVNQVWVSDITYYQIGDRYYFLTFIMDQFSRRILGHSVSKTLMTIDTTLPALQRSLKKRQIGKGLIFHSDGGGQYYCKEFLEVIRGNEMISSMGTTAYENPNAERINGTIKNSYLNYFEPRDYADLVRKTARAVTNYNYRPHSSLKKKTPLEFEREQGINVEIWTSPNSSPVGKIGERACPHSNI